ncbi:MAG: LuxR family transcriptional regulator [Pseudomonadota bacterium]
MNGDVERFIQESLAITSPARLIECFLAFMHDHGIDYVSYHYTARDFQRIPYEDSVRAMEFPDEWIDRYRSEHYDDIDPIISRARQVERAFNWFDIENQPLADPKARQMIADLRAAGFKDGVAVPAFIRPGDIAYFGLGAKEQDLHLSELQLYQLQMICQHVHIRYNELVDKESMAKLAPREVQVLELIARGKSTPAIGESLGISRNTVDTLTRRIFEKMGVSTRVEAALRGVSQGLILA